MQRLRLNHGGYRGETIDIDRVLLESEAAARAHGLRVEQLPKSGANPLLVFHRNPPAAQRNLYLSTGIHGDEPAGPLAVRQLLQENQWPDDASVWLFPCLNPGGFRLNRRENEDDFDLNRDYRHLDTAAIRAHVTWLERQTAFVLCLCLHEDWESHGFYLYELNPDGRPSLAEVMIASAQPVCPIDLSSEIEGREAHGGIIRPSVDPAVRARWPEAFYLIQRKTRLSYTLEAPSDFPLATRVAALVAATRVALNRAC
jgi:predicted deacylase